jgi:hypothetical protein
MKRPYRHEFVSSVWPLLFWLRCVKCGEEFRREKGWQTQTGPYYGGHGVILSLCHGCAPTKEDAERVLKEIAETKRKARLLALTTDGPRPAGQGRSK